jgi:hypothetical protein
MTALVMLCALAVGQAPASGPKALSEEQLTRLRELVRATRVKAADLRRKLAEHEHELAQLYGQFELNVRQAEELQAEIGDLQKQLLANYHKLQIGLREIVGPERFEILKARIDNSLRNESKPAASRPKAPSPKNVNNKDR